MKALFLKTLNEKYYEQISKKFDTPVKLVYGNGDPDSNIVLVGEAPGKSEVIKGKPFVGQAGKNLDEFLKILEISKDALYITNVVKIRPYKINPKTGREVNRPPTKEEISIFTGFIKEELDIIRPKLIITLGNTALKCITESDVISIGNVHGVLKDVSFSTLKLSIFPLYHPASIIYRQELKRIYIEDLYKLKEIIKNFL